MENNRLDLKRECSYIIIRKKNLASRLKRRLNGGSYEGAKTEGLIFYARMVAREALAKRIYIFPLNQRKRIAGKS